MGGGNCLILENSNITIGISGTLSAHSTCQNISGSQFESKITIFGSLLLNLANTKLDIYPLLDFKENSELGVSLTTPDSKRERERERERERVCVYVF